MKKQPEPKPKPKTKPRPEPVPETNPKPRPKSNSKPRHKPKSKPGTKPGPKSSPVSKPKPGTKPGPKSSPVSKPKPETKPGPKSSPVSKSKPETKWHVSLVDLAKFYDAPHLSTITKQIKIVGFPADCKIKHGVYDLKKYNDWRISHFFGDENIKTTMAAEKLRYQIARSNREENNDKKEREILLDRGKLLQGFSIVLTGLRNRFLGWYKTQPPMLIGKDEKQMGMILRTETRALLADLADGVKSVIPKKRRPKPRAVENKKN